MSASSTTRRPKRLLAACRRCHSQKIKCSGEQPCRSCMIAGKAEECHVPTKERKITVTEGYLKMLEADSKRLRSQSSHVSGGSGTSTPKEKSINSYKAPPFPSEESNLFNPLFDKQQDRQIHERSAEPGFIGEASCAAFSNRLLACLDSTCPPLTSGLSNYHRLDDSVIAPADQSPEFPERMHVKLLLNVARRFIGNYHPLFLEVSFMKEIDAVYRGDAMPSTLWLCKFYALMALGEIYTHRRGVGDNNRVPGTMYFVRAVNLLQKDQDAYEEPSLIQVEVLTLLAWASNILGRIRTAYIYSGIAMRIAMSLGMHRAASRHSALSPVERESRRRTWWVLYFFDRFSASKIGQPLTIRDEDIDVEMPSIDGLTQEEMAEFLDPRNLIINIKLARIIGNILTQIYGIPKATKGLYIHQVHSILNQLRAWQDELPQDMRIVERSTPRPVASLHLAYNQCIIQTTRPVLLHMFKLQFQLGTRPRENTPKQGISSITHALAESCIIAAQASSRLVESLFLDGSIATFGFWDAHHIFSAAMILIMSAIMKPSSLNSDLLETLLSVLRSLKDNGNIPAVDFCERLSQIQARVSKLRASGRFESTTAGLQARFRHSGALSKENSPVSAYQGQPSDTPVSMQDQRQKDHPETIIHNDIDVLGDPIINSFLDDNQMQLLDSILPEGGIPNDFASDLNEHFLLGSW